MHGPGGCAPLGPRVAGLPAACRPTRATCAGVCHALLGSPLLAQWCRGQAAPLPLQPAVCIDAMLCMWAHLSAADVPRCRPRPPRRGAARTLLLWPAVQLDFTHGVSASQLSLCLYLPIEIPYEYLAGKLGTAFT
jgi:hypothetical protein